MKQFRGSGAPISLILATVFPAILAAALALAYYGFRYADSVSRPIEALFRETSREEGEKLVADLEARIKDVALSLFDRIAVEKKEPTLAGPCELAAGPVIDSYVVLNAKKREECYSPRLRSPAEQRKLTSSWQLQLKMLEWEKVKLGTFHHYHELTPEGSVLIVYTARASSEGDNYFVAARFKVDMIVARWLEEGLTRMRKSMWVSVLDDEGGVVSGAAVGDPLSAEEARFLYDGPFGRAFYHWRMQIAPLNADVFRSQAERRKVLGPLLIVLSTVIIAVGLGVVWLAVLAERRASRLKSDFIANVSHELKTPLSLIRMFGELVATGKHKGEDAAREYGGIITRESERLSHLIDNVLDFARLERGKASYDFAEGDLGEVVERALDICHYRLEKEKLRLRTEIEPGLPLVRMDENALTLVILNLVDNAIKYAADGGEVLVSLSRAPGGVVLAVRDLGPGIGADEQDRIFERFYRARGARDRNVRGSGIGLALVKHIAEAHGGRVTVESPVAARPPEAEGTAAPPGCIFRVHLPAPVPEGAPSSAALRLDPIEP